MTFATDAMGKDDWNQVRAIYREGLATGLAAFMTDPPSWRTWNARHMTIGRFVAHMDDGTVGGWSALAPVPDT